MTKGLPDSFTSRASSSVIPRSQEILDSRKQSTVSSQRGNETGYKKITEVTRNMGGLPTEGSVSKISALPVTKDDIPETSVVTSVVICLTTIFTIHSDRPVIAVLTFRALRHSQPLERLLFRCIIRNAFRVHIACYIRHYLEIRVASYLRNRSVMMIHFSGID